MRVGSTYPLPSVGGITGFTVWECLSNFIPHYPGYVITYPCREWNWSRGPWWDRLSVLWSQSICFRTGPHMISIFLTTAQHKIDSFTNCMVRQENAWFDTNMPGSTKMLVSTHKLPFALSNTKSLNNGFFFQFHLQIFLKNPYRKVNEIILILRCTEYHYKTGISLFSVVCENHICTCHRWYECVGWHSSCNFLVVIVLLSKFGTRTIGTVCWSCFHNALNNKFRYSV